MLSGEMGVARKSKWTAEGVWPRLQSSHEKPHWISLDFSHFEYQHDGSEEEGEEEGEGKDIDPEMRKKMVSVGLRRWS